MKTNKSFLKRVKVSKNGKLRARKPGQNHFNAKEGRNSQLNKKRTGAFVIGNKERSRYLVNSSQH